ncbi:kelch-like protein 26 [Ostrea edulis]|uniref:kelch-like protein 26 n=1 Tax=Ostrea edulis TaxID=37623 RepID=UPI0020952165|nr:kelch-like protein 26 [Ostrea edulis]
MPLSPRKMTRQLNPSGAEFINNMTDNTLPLMEMSLKARNHFEKIVQGLDDLRQKSLLCDYTLKADEESFAVHKVVMVACSDYFQAMLTSNMKECHEDIVELKGISANGLKIIVDFAYTGELKLNTQNVEDVLSAATHLQVSDAMDLCSKYLEASISVRNCVDILNIAELYSLVSLCQASRQFMLHNFEELAESEQYSMMNNVQLAQLLAENSLRVSSEFLLFNLVLKWIRYDPGEREQFVSVLIENIKLPLMSGGELVEKVSKVPIMKQNPDCSKLLTEAKDYHIVVSKQPLLQNKRTEVRSDTKVLVMCHASNLETFNFGSNKRGYLREAIVPLYNPSVAVVDNFLYTCGGKYEGAGSSTDIATARCFRYDPRFDTWFELASMNEPRKDFVMLALDSKLYAIAGQDENKVMHTVECYDITTNEWEMKQPLSRHVYGHAGCVCSDKIYVSGGQVFVGTWKKLFAYSPSEDTWEERASMLQNRLNHVMMEVKEKIYVIGGNIEDVYGFPIPIAEIERYCPSANQWTVCKAKFNIREAGSCVLNNTILIVGGIGGEHYVSEYVQKYDPEKDKVEIVEHFATRINGKACAILTLPHYI